MVKYQGGVVELFNKQDLKEVHRLAMEYVKDERYLLDHSIARCWVEAGIHVLIKKDLIKVIPEKADE